MTVQLEDNREVDHGQHNWRDGVSEEHKVVLEVIKFLQSWVFEKKIVVYRCKIWNQRCQKPCSELRMENDWTSEAQNEEGVQGG